MKWIIEIKSNCGFYYGNVTCEGTEIIISFPFDTPQTKKDVEDFFKSIGCSYVEKENKIC